MINTQILEALQKMPNTERLEVIEFALRLVREEMNQVEPLNLAMAAKIMQSFYAENSTFTEFVDTCNEDFHEYQDYA